jgi:hypothetical protein
VRETEIDFAWLTEHIPYGFRIHWRDGRPAVWSFRKLPSELEDRQWEPLVMEIIIRASERQSEQAYLPPVKYERDAAKGGWYDLRAVPIALDAHSISFRLKIEKSTSMGDQLDVEGEGIEIRVRFASGTEVIDSRFTFGQKRLITIALGALLCGGSPLLVDEIDNGLHPGLVEKVLGLIRGRQTFIASHNKLVVDLLDYESPEDIGRTIHICQRNQDGTQSLVALSDEQVREVFEKIEVGLMNPSDVLQREGLW